MQLKDYIKGDKRGKEANRFERETMNDPFLLEALEGLETVPGNHAETIERLEKRIGNINNNESQKSRKTLYYLSFAASILLLIGVGIYFLLDNSGYQDTIAKVQYMQADEQVDADLSHAPSTSEIEEQMESVPTPEKAVIPIVESNISLRAESKVQNRSKEILQVHVEDVQVSTDEELSDQLVAQVATVSVSEVDKTKEAVDVKEAVSSKEAISAQVAVDVDEAFIMEELGVPLEESIILSYGSSSKSKVKVEKKERNSAQTIVNPAPIITNPTSANARTAPITNSSQPVFGQKEFQEYCRQKAEKNICDSKNITVRVSFYIDHSGKPTNIECNRYTCEEAKKEIEKLLTSSPAWTSINRKVIMTVKW